MESCKGRRHYFWEVISVFVSSRDIHQAPTESQTKPPDRTSDLIETTAPRTQRHPAFTERLERLKATKLEEEELLSQTGITDPSEGDFSNCVQPILSMCSKESIAVRSMLCYWWACIPKFTIICSFCDLVVQFIARQGMRSLLGGNPYGRVSRNLAWQ